MKPKTLRTDAAASPAAASTPVPARRPPGLRRLADDTGLAVIVSSWAALVITLVSGRPQDLYEEMVVSFSIGFVALLVIGTARRLFFPGPIVGRRWAPFLVLLLATAPVAHFLGMTLGAALLGIPAPRLADYAGVRRLSMVLFTLCAMAGITFLIVNRERLARIRAARAQAEAHAETVQRQALETQLRLLQAQIEPHMLFNTLANLRGLIAIDPARAGTMLDDLIAYLRATLSVSRSASTTLAQEFAAIEAYLGLMAVRMGERLAHRCALPDDLRGARLPTMLLQPLVENAIVHGLEPHVDGGEIFIMAARDDDALVITIADTGLGLVGMAPHGRSTQGGGVGLNTTRERLRALYGERAGVDLVPNHPRGALARLTLPLESA